MLAAVVALALAADPLLPLQKPLAELAAKKPATVDGVRAALKAVRELENAARSLLAKGVEPRRVHQALAQGWTAVEQLETALFVDGQGEGPERAAIRAMSDARARDAHAIAASEREPTGKVPTEALQACWQEHLLSTDKPDSLDVKVIVELDGRHAGALEFVPPMGGFREHLRECLSTRLLGLVVSEDADAIEIPLHFTAPAK